MACCLFVREETDGVNLLVSWLQSRLEQEILFQTEADKNKLMIKIRFVTSKYGVILTYAKLR
jgi:hypothetical protein